MGRRSSEQRLLYALASRSHCPLCKAQEDLLALGETGRRNREVGTFHTKGHLAWRKEEGQGLVGSGPDTAGGSIWGAFAEPRVLGMAALCLTDSAPAAPGQESGPGSLPLLDCQKP